MDQNGNLELNRVDTDVTTVKIPTEKSQENSVSYEDALRTCGFGKFQLKVCLLGGLFVLLVLNESMGMAFIMPAAQCDLNLNSNDKGLLSAMVFIGIMTSAHFWGYMGDTQGRRPVILFCLIFSFVFTLASTFTNNLGVFMFFRFMVGVFISGVSSTSYAYIGEFVSVENRATVISWISVSVGLSSCYLPLAGWWILSYDWSLYIFDGYSFRPWRLLLVVFALPAIIGATWLKFFPESPRFLLSQGKTEEALKLLAKIYEENKKSTQEKFPVKQLTPELNENYQDLKTLKGIKPIFKSIMNQTVPLFKPPYLKNFAACCFLHFGTFAVATGMGIWFPEIMNRISGASGSDDLNICEMLDMEVEKNNTTIEYSECSDSVDMSVWINALILGVAFSLSYVVLSLVIKPLGRRVVFVITLFSSGLSGFVILFVSDPISVIVLYSIFLIGCSVNVSVINGAAVNVFPTHLRAMSVCISMLCGRLAGAVFPNIVGYLLEANCHATFYSLAALPIICGFVSFVLPAR